MSYCRSCLEAQSNAKKTFVYSTTIQCFVKLFSRAQLDEPEFRQVLSDLPDVAHVIVVDNGSNDRTAQVAEQAGATVIHEPNRGYGAACLRGLDRELGAPSPPCVLPRSATNTVFVKLRSVPCSASRQGWARVDLAKMPKAVDGIAGSSCLVIRDLA